MKAVNGAAESGVPVIGICNGFRLLRGRPAAGALLRQSLAAFCCGP